MKGRREDRCFSLQSLRMPDNPLVRQVQTPLVRDDKIVDAAARHGCSRFMFHFEGARGRARLFDIRSQDVTEIIIVWTDIRDIVVKKDATAAGDECSDRLALLGCYPVGEKIISSTSRSFPTVRRDRGEGHRAAWQE